MGPRGPAPRPRALKLLNGTGEGRDSGGRRVRNDPKHIRQAPEKPNDLSAKASALWDIVVDDLEVTGALKVSDGPALEMLCEAYATWKILGDRIGKAGRLVKRPSGVVVLSPLVRDQREAAREFLILAREFGITPSALQRLSADDPSAVDGQNPFAAGAIS